MRFDPIEFKIRGYITAGTEKLESQDLDIHIPKNVRAHYIGMSSITKCGRLLWAEHNHPTLLKQKPVDARVARIFDLGHICEDVILQTLKLGGAGVSGEQTFFHDFDKQFRGHCDCIIDWNLIGEIKSMNDESYNRFLTMDLQTSHFSYYVQVQLYQYYSGLLDGILIATNKNNSATEVQRIPFDQKIVDFHRSKVETIVKAKSIFHIDQPYTVKSIKECDFCPLRKVCHGY